MNERSEPVRPSEWLLIAGMCAVMLAGGVMRLLWLGEHPYGLYQDEAVNGLDALDVLAGARPLYFEANNGREPLFIYLVAAGVAIFGRTPLGIRAAAALVGLLTIPAVYLLGSSWGGRRVGWLSAGILAALLWHVHLSRIGLRAVSLPLFMALALGLGALALRRCSRWLALAAGAAYGLGFYTYLAVRFTPLALAGMLVYGAIWHRAWLRERRHLLLWMGGAALVIATPLLVYGLLQPEIVMGRSGQVAIWSRTDFPILLSQNVLRTLGMFTWRGDWIWRHNVPGRPVFDPLLGLAFLAGVVLGLVRWRSRPILALGLIWTAVMVLPTLLADDAPHFLRGVGVLPVVVLFPAAALDALAVWISQRPARRNEVFVTAGLVSLLAVSALWTARDYFGCSEPSPLPVSGFDYAGCYRTDPVRGYFFQEEATTLARDLNAAQGSIYLDRRYWATFPSVRFLATRADDLILYDEGAVLEEGHSPLTLFAWPHVDLAPTLKVLPAAAVIDISPGPETRGDQEPEPYVLYVRYAASSLESMELSEPLARFDGGLHLVDARIETRDLEQSASYGVVVTLLWQVEEPWHDPITMFVHGVDEDGQVVDQSDEPPGTIYYPPLSWRPGSVIIHRVWLTVPRQDDIWHLLVGLYDPLTGRRLPVRQSSLTQYDDALILPIEPSQGRE